MLRTNRSWLPLPFLILGLFSFLLVSCNMPAGSLPFLGSPVPSLTNTSLPTAEIIPTNAELPTNTATGTPTSTEIPSPTITHTPSPSPTSTETPSPTETATETQTPTLESAFVTVEQNVNCRWGPSTMYMYAGLIPDGGTAFVDGRNYESTWLWIKMEGIKYHCWVAASAVVFHGDMESVPRVSTDPPTNPSVPSPQNVQATRNNDKVTITWTPAPPARDLHYLIKAKTCDGQSVISWLDTTTNTAYTVTDKQTCSGTSSVKIFVVNKLGYSIPVEISLP